MANTIHFIGIGGVGMSAIAGILLEKGFKVSGSDMKESKVTRKLAMLGGKIFLGHVAENISDEVGEVVISSAIKEDNPELVEAKRRNIKILRRAEKLAELMKGTKALCVAGAHGKTTVSGMLSLVMERAGLDPTIVIGGFLDNIDGNFKLGKGEYLVAEADESDKTFLMLEPFGSIITNIEDDHMENYGSMENIVRAFKEFIILNKNQELIVVCKDNEYLSEFSKENKNITTYSFNDKSADYYADRIEYKGIGITGEIYKKGNLMGHLDLNIPGKHNFQNALGVVALCDKLGMEFDCVNKAFEEFYGVNRRFQILKNENGIIIVDDYAHHPAEIKATLNAAREAHQGRIITVFQPHRYTRTKQFLNDFAESFENSDLPILIPVYSAGEDEIDGISSERIVEQIPNENALFIDGFEKTIDYLYGEMKPGDIILTMGAGDVNKIGYSLRERMIGTV